MSRTANDENKNCRSLQIRLTVMLVTVSRLGKYVSSRGNLTIPAVARGIKEPAKAPALNEERPKAIILEEAYALS